MFPVAFAAEQVSFDPSDGAAEIEGEIYVGFGRLRFERPASGGTVVTLVDPQSKTGYVVSPGDQVQIVHNFVGVVGSVGEDGLSKYFLPVNPANPCESYRDIVSCRPITQEYVNGRWTTKWEYTHALGGESWNSYEWIDTKLRVAVKRQYKNHVTELRTIREQAEPAFLFELPTGPAR